MNTEYRYDAHALEVAQKIMECRATAAEDGWPDVRLKAAIQCLVIEAMKWAAPAQAAPEAWGDVIAERQRQVSAEGWTPEHDDQHSSGELAGAAACYARHVNGRQWIYPIRPESYASEDAPHEWPWDEAWWKPKSPRRDLVRAAALILAEIERLDRAAPAPGGEHG